MQWSCRPWARKVILGQISQRDGNQKGLLPCCWFWVVRVFVQEAKRSLEMLNVALSWPAARKWDLSLTQHGLGSAHTGTSKEIDFPPEPPERNEALPTLWSYPGETAIDFCPPEISDNKSVVLSHEDWGNLLQQQQKTIRPLKQHLSCFQFLVIIKKSHYKPQSTIFMWT